MSTPGDTQGGPPTPPNNSTVLLLLGDIADTTWRMFGPIILLAGIGMWADSHLHSSPYLAIAGVILGSIVAAVLIRQQLKKVQKHYDK